MIFKTQMKITVDYNVSDKNHRHPETKKEQTFTIDGKIENFYIDGVIDAIKAHKLNKLTLAAISKHEDVLESRIDITAVLDMVPHKVLEFYN